MFYSDLYLVLFENISLDGFWHARSLEVYEDLIRNMNLGFQDDSDGLLVKPKPAFGVQGKKGSIIECNVDEFRLQMGRTGADFRFIPALSNWDRNFRLKGRVN